MTTRRWRTHGRRGTARTATFVAAAAVVVSGCSLLGAADGEDTTENPPTSATSTRPTPREGTLLKQGTTSVTLEVGERVQVSLPRGSLGVGDLWGIGAVGDPDVAVASIAIGERVFGEEPADKDTPAPGSSSAFAVEIEAVATGTTTVRAIYCTRVHEVSQGCDQSEGTLDPPVKPVEITVRVR